MAPAHARVAGGSGRGERQPARRAGCHAWGAASPSTRARPGGPGSTRPGRRPKRRSRMPAGAAL